MTFETLNLNPAIAQAVDYIGSQNRRAAIERVAACAVARDTAGVLGQQQSAVRRGKAMDALAIHVEQPRQITDHARESSKDIINGQHSCLHDLLLQFIGDAPDMC